MESEHENGYSVNRDRHIAVRRRRVVGSILVVMSSEGKTMDRQEFLDRFYFEKGPCCAGCDWWRSISSKAGDCTKSAPVSGSERWAMLGIESCSMGLSPGHIVTAHNHKCGDFKDEFDWATLPLPYRRRIGAPVSRS